MGWCQNKVRASTAPSNKTIGELIFLLTFNIDGSVKQGLASNLDDFFSNIRRMCESDNDTISAGPDPYMLAIHRTCNWPVATGLPTHLAEIYEKVRQSGIPNSLGVRHTLPSKLNLQEWRSVFGSFPQFKELLDFVEFGFLMGYLGPESHYDEKYNHSSAEDFSQDINKFLKKEIKLTRRGSRTTRRQTI